MSLKISVVIPTYNSKDLLQKCLASLEHQSAPFSDFEVIVVDDGSEDGTMEALKTWEQKTPLNLKSQYISNSGPATARNTGVQHASSEWIAFLDADVTAHVDWVKRALELIAEHPDGVAFEGKTLLTDRPKLTPFTHQTENLQGGRYLTCNMVLRKAVCHFYPKYRLPHFREDTDLAFCLMASGYTIHFDPHLKVFHPPLSAAWNRPLKLALRYYYDGLLRRRFPKYYRKNVDAHRLWGRWVPHARRKIYGVFLLGQILLLAGWLLPFESVLLPLALVIFCPAYGLTCWLYFRAVLPESRKLKDLLLLMAVNLAVPWVMYFQLFRGFLFFRHEPPFDAKQWANALKLPKNEGGF